MLQQLRQNSGSLIIWVMFVLIIAAFVLFFGPQAGPDMFSCGAGAGDNAVKAGEREIPVSAWRFAMQGLPQRRGEDGIARRSRALDFAVERSLLAGLAEDAGFEVSEKLINDRIKRGELWIMGYRFDGRRSYFRSGVLDYDALERMAQSLGQDNIDRYRDQQHEELMADLGRDLLIQSASVSVEEVRNTYIERNNKVALDFVSFPVSTYQRAVQLSEADINRYLADHNAEVVAEWEKEKAQWQTEKTRVLARHVFVKKVPKPVPDPKPKKDGKTDGDSKPTGDDKEPEPDTAKTPPVDNERARAEQAKKRLDAGEDFAAVAAELSDDTRNKMIGGRLTWRPPENLGFGKEVSEVAKTLEVGKVSDVIETPRGYHVIRIDERTDKALTFDQRKFGVAGKLALAYYGRAAARVAAETALAQAKDKPLEQLFEKYSPPAFNPGQLQIPPNATPEQIQEILRQLQQQGGGAGQTGWIFEQGDTQLAQDTPTPAAAQAAPDASKPAPEAAVTLPAMAEVPKPKLRTVRLVPRDGDRIIDVGKSAALVDDLFDKLEKGAVADKVYEVEDPDAFVIVMLTDRELADMEKFKDEVETLTEELTRSKAAALVHDWVTERCRALAKAGEIEVNPTILVDENDKPVAYQACARISPFDTRDQIQLRSEPPPDVTEPDDAGQ